MKKAMVIIILAIFLISFAFAENNESGNDDENGTLCTEEIKQCPDGSYISRNTSNGCKFDECPEEEDEDDDLLGASCGTVTPGTQNECCVNKGYSGWNQEKFKCIEEDEEKCEAWKCTQWSNCINGEKTRRCVKTAFNCTTDNIQPVTSKNCSEKERFGFHEKSRDCPGECVCSGSTIKCTFENGTKVMTIYAGNSGNVIVQIKNLNMSTNVTLYKGENGKVYGTFKGNKTREIVLPDDVKERLHNHTRTKLYNESINLTEDGYYKVEMKKKARLFWLVPVREHMEANVSAENGEIVKIRNPWWGFLAKDVENSEEQ